MFDIDPLAFWRTHHDKFWLVAKAVRLLLHGAISGTHVERILSVATNLYSARRKGLTPSYFSYLMLLKLNYLVDDADVVSTDPIDLEELQKTFGKDNRPADYSKERRSNVRMLAGLCLFYIPPYSLYISFIILFYLIDS